MGLFGDPVRTSSLKTAERGKTVKGYVKCVCGNTFSDAGIDDGNHLGFHWCDKEGIHLTYSSDFIRCRKCGRIMNRKSLQIRGVTQIAYSECPSNKAQNESKEDHLEVDSLLSGPIGVVYVEIIYFGRNAIKTAP